MINTQLKITACFLLIAVIALSSCKKGSSPVVNKPVDIYISGTITAANGVTVAAYWKNGAITLLADSMSNSIAHGIAVSGADVYVAGSTTSANGNTIATIWKNGVAAKLTDGSSNAEARAITVSGSDVYAAGVAPNSSGYFFAVYWRNNVPTLLAPGNGNAIAIVGNDVYVAGGVSATNPNSGNSENLAGYWKNGTSTAFQYPFLSAVISNQANGIAVSGSDIYVAGYDNAGELWKNGVKSTLSGGQAAYPWAVIADGGNVYVGGYANNANNHFVATIWKNGLATQLSDGTSDANVFAIALNGTDYYAAGMIGISSGATVPYYWKNGSKVMLPGIGYASGLVLISN